jgi:hypothetical protein
MVANYIAAGASALSAISSVFGGGGLSERKAAALEFDYQKRLAEERPAWLVEGAKRAGISPLVAMGMQPTNAPAVQAFGKDNFFSKVGEMGQGISRAAEAYSDSKQRASLFEQESRMNELKIKNAEIQNAMAASDLALRRTGKTVPINDTSSQLIAGQGDVQKNPSEYTASRRGNPSLEAAPPAPAVKEFIMSDGTRVLWPSKDAKNAIEDSPYEYEHMYRNRILPWFRSKRSALTDEIFRRYNRSFSRF